MNKLGVKGKRVLKIFHLVFAIMWIGGVMALVSLMLGMQPESPEMMWMAAKSHLVVDEFFLIPGGIGIVVSAFAYGFFTEWGFFKHRWITVKWILTIALVLIGVFLMGRTIEYNMAYSDLILREGADEKLWWANVHKVTVCGFIQIVGFAIVIILSVLKPGRPKKQIRIS